ncbi:hypothetical protein N7489_000218 [Penicillium chrysogenum]|uniref:Uncharacterized protein n=1 Tax=Penicillium chrysogenum TaxID=5076 RepID=A0ABQ8WFD6_PENCH|nr:uncharacterized protein N7489_000218 [Penicillium chrysogenum]KAJ5249808.1 hypothetical protein N7489_000218 [Penicillium chrysogenum]KAJ5268713.1 hypothetical protein N7505_004471 [Penicillium chrysogenum]KAJ6148578.1 hypothetical protein N7497_010560 [Penicillium chrysogenum]
MTKLPHPSVAVSREPQIRGACRKRGMHTRDESGREEEACWPARVGSDSVLDGQAIVYIVEGTEKNLTDNVNRIASILTLTVCETANATTNVVRSDLIEEVTAESSAQRKRPLPKRPKDQPEGYTD